MNNFQCYFSNIEVVILLKRGEFIYYLKLYYTYILILYYTNDNASVNAYIVKFVLYA